VRQGVSHGIDGCRLAAGLFVSRVVRVFSTALIPGTKPWSPSIPVSIAEEGARDDEFRAATFQELASTALPVRRDCAFHSNLPDELTGDVLART
jgi:hypothetical protein